jgi:hypothetical protein
MSKAINGAHQLSSWSWNTIPTLVSREDEPGDEHIMTGVEKPECDYWCGIEPGIRDGHLFIGIFVSGFCAAFFGLECDQNGIVDSTQFLSNGHAHGLEWIAFAERG